MVTASLAIAVAGGVCLSAVNAPAQAKDIKAAFFASPKHPIWSKLMVPWGKAIEAENVGLKVIGFPGSQIGGRPPGAFKRVMNGIADLEFVMQGYTSTVFPRTLLVEIPLQWGSPTDATKAIWRIFDKHLAKEYKRVKVLAMWVTDTPAVMTNKIVRTPDDLKGLKLRTPSRNQAAIIKGFGAIPVGMPMPQTYGAIEKGVVDGAIVGISVVNSFKLAEVVKNYIVDLPMGYSPQMIAMNRKVYDGLSAKQRAAIDKHSGLALSLKGAKLYERARMGGIKTVNKRKDTRVTTLTAAEKAAWKARLETIVAKWIKTFEKKGLPYREMLNDYLAKGS
ncbi:MAG: TRAP transporter substrate-binding protein [Alphaproteobacteria bacterium]